MSLGRSPGDKAIKGKWADNLAIARRYGVGLGSGGGVCFGERPTLVVFGRFHTS